MLKEEESQIVKLYEENVSGTFSDNDLAQQRALESSQNIFWRRKKRFDVLRDDPF
jgi:hypothetical protein